MKENNEISQEMITSMKENNGISQEMITSMKENNGISQEMITSMKENNGISQEMITSESFPKEVDNTEKYDKSKCEINNSEKIGDMVTVTADKRRCQRPLRDIIGKREQRREELEKMEGDLRQRLDMLECSIPAVMIWNIWRMSQGAPVCRIKRILEKQFKDTRELSCRSTPSCHYDCRVREVEAERKLALKKVEEARTLWSEKLATLEERKRKLDEARKIQEEQRNAIERLNEENRMLQEAMEKKPIEIENELCQCGDTQCKQRYLSKVSSVTSIESGDIQCLEKLQRLAEEEMITKREITELERREEAYMRTLQQADELWSKMEGDMVNTTSALQEQLDMKTTANQQLANRVCELEDALEKCRTRLVTCRTELEKFLSIEKVEATIGRDDDVAKVVDKEVAVKAKVVHRPIGRIDDIATVKDDEVLAKVEVVDEEVLAKIKVVDEEALAITEVEDKEALARVALIADIEPPFIMDDKFVSVKPDLVDLAVDRPVDLVQITDVESIVRPEDVAYEQQKFEEAREYLAQLDSLEDLYTDDGVPCAPDFVCNDVVTSPTGMTDEELTALGVEHPVLTKEYNETVITEEQERQFKKEELVKKLDNAVDEVEKREKKEDEIPDVEIERKIAEKVENGVAEVVDVRETVTRAIEEAEDDRLVTMPKDRAPEVNSIEAGNNQNQDIVIQRKTILSWIDAIDTIRTTAAKHPDCHEVKKDADTLAEQVSTYVGIKPKEVEEENATINTEGKQEKVIEKNKIKTEKLISETELQDELIILKAKETKPAIKIDSEPFHISEEVSAEVNASMEAIDESELLPTKEEVPIDVKLPTEESEFVERVAEKSEENSTLDETKISDMKEMIPPMEIVEVSPISEKEEVEQENAMPVVDIKEVEKMIPETISPTVDITEVEKFEPDKFPIVEKAPITIEAIEEKIKVEEPILNEKEDSLLLDAIETAETLPIAEIVKKEENEVTKPSPIEVMEKKEKIEAVKLPPISDIVREEKIETVELPSISDIVKEEKIEAAEVSPITDIAKEEKIEPAEVLPITDIVKKEQIEAAELIKEEKIEAEELLRADEVTEEKIEIIQPIPTLPTIKKEMEEEIEEDLEKVLKEKIKKDEDEEVKEVPLPEEVRPIELFEKKEEEKILQMEKEEIPTIAPLLKKSKIKEVPEEKRPEMIQIELKIPIAEIKSTEMEVPAIPFDSRLVPYLIIAKIKEKEPQIIPAKPPCTECCSQPPIETTRQFEIPQIDVPQTEIVQTEVIQSEVVQTKMIQTEIIQNKVEQAKVVQTESVKTEVVQITSQTISIPEPPRIQSISEYSKSTELKASRTEIAGDRPEITGRKMLWRERLKDQSTVTTSSIGSQTDKTSHVSHDRVVRDERERARVPTDELLRSIKIAAGLARPDTEREIRTINYGGKSDEMGRTTCNCCSCGKTPTSPSTRPRLEVQPQIDATPPAASTFKRMFIRPKIDQPILHDRLCSDCKAKIQSKIPHERQHIEKIIKKICHDQESCRYVSLTSKSCAISQKRIIKKRDQACLAKISKQKINPVEQKRKDNLQSILEEKSTVEPLSASCICFKLEKTGAEPIKKGNCYCGD
ncbi:PREDICTED: titin-like [Acromyrmex echinatior]|uniref:titin-like n=1 Tax=Acromyrmex echinatior TaxID=103372 RepID=UPI0005810240|nr:PREDICTED: titin-like [Acromyrmex echinatior]